MLINKEQITSIVIKDKEESKFPYYFKKPRIINFWYKKSKFIEGGLYESSLFGDDYIINKVPFEYMLENEKVYLKDRIYINTSDNKQKALYFNTIEERDTYINTHFNDRKYFKINE